MKDDPRFCSVCDKPLLKQDRFGFVLVTRCDQCNHLVHDRCYLAHHVNFHELIGVITELDDKKELIHFY